LLHLRRGADGHVDLIFVDSTFLDDVVRRATPIDLGVVTLPVATTEDLLLLKLEAHRTEDLDDILAIKDACAEQLDMTYVRAQAGRLGLLERLELYFGR
jgi:predicted nucleotidyltransferase